jgi:TusA-related sulfurtransferase
VSVARVKLDLRGEVCPYPLQETKREVQEMPCGTEVEVMVDCPPAVKNLSKWAENAGHSVLEAMDLGPAEWMVVLKTCGDQATVAAIAEGAATT